MERNAECFITPEQRDKALKAIEPGCFILSVVELDQWEVTDPQEAISHYISIEGLQAERALNALR